MYGLAGIVDYARFTDEGLLRHRGPDAAGLYMNGPAVLAHTRLRIINLSTGDQPIRNEDGTCCAILSAKAGSGWF